MSENLIDRKLIEEVSEAVVTRTIKPARRINYTLILLAPQIITNGIFAQTHTPEYGRWGQMVAFGMGLSTAEVRFFGKGFARAVDSVDLKTVAKRLPRRFQYSANEASRFANTYGRGETINILREAFIGVNRHITDGLIEWLIKAYDVGYFLGGILPEISPPHQEDILLIHSRFVTRLRGNPKDHDFVNNLFLKRS